MGWPFIHLLQRLQLFFATDSPIPRLVVHVSATTDYARHSSTSAAAADINGEAAVSAGRSLAAAVGGETGSARPVRGERSRDKATVDADSDHDGEEDHVHGVSAPTACAPIGSFACYAPPATGARHAAGISACAFSNTGALVATASLDGSVIVRSATTLAATDTIRQAAPFTSISFGRMDRWLLTAARDGAVTLWDLREPGVSGSTISKARDIDVRYQSAVLDAKLTNTEDCILANTTHS